MWLREMGRAMLHRQQDVCGRCLVRRYVAIPRLYINHRSYAGARGRGGRVGHRPHRAVFWHKRCGFESVCALVSVGVG